MISCSLRPFGSKSLPPFPAPLGMPVSAFLNICSNDKNLTVSSVTLLWNLNPPLYGPSALLNWMRKPRFTCTTPWSSIHGTRKMICRSGSQMRSMSLSSRYSGCFATKGPREARTSSTACRKSRSPWLRCSILAWMSRRAWPRSRVRMESIRAAYCFPVAVGLPWRLMPTPDETDTVFTTDRLVVRRWRDSDLAALLAVYGDADAMRWVGDAQPLTGEEAERWLEVTASNYRLRGYGMFAMEDVKEGDVIGFCGIVHPGGQAEAE